MKINRRVGWFVSLAGLFATLARGEEAAVVKENNVNVRGQASFQGETITQLKQGEKVVILEEIPVANPKKGEPAAWAKIKMPANTPVWVNSSFLDLQTKTVKSPRLNLRAGPGENFSVVGRLQKGDAIKEIRTVDSWVEIEAPATAYAFVAAHLLSKDASAPATAAKAEPAPAVKPSAPVPTPAPVAAAAPAPALPVTEKVVPAEAPAAAPLVEAAAPKVVPPVSPAQPAPVAAAPAVVAAPKPEPAKAAAAEKPEAAATPAEPPPKRVVRREGIVRGTVSIQAPAYFEITGTESGKVIGYLHLTDKVLEHLGTTIKGFKDYIGRAVVVTGEEGVDPRWPRTPVIEVETLKLVL